ncbi:flagellar hook-length control protein FliK [Psychromonas sp. KJ10-2]|uniref:flagellar hook-length control protein FliK n=1 Tax=Psychromonas sp. KJ10-2 TaxID=3391822 RepID=UPI0039B53290
MMQPLFLAGNTASDLKAHKESEVTENGLLSSEQGSSLNKLRFSELLNDKIVADKTPTDNAAKLHEESIENPREVPNNLINATTSLTEQNQEIDQNQQQLVVSDSPTNKVIGQNLVNQQESTVEVLPTTTNDNAELTSTDTQVVDRQATEQLSEQPINALEQQQADISFSSLSSTNEPLEQTDPGDINSVDMLDELTEPKADTLDPESVVDSQLAAGHIDNIQTVDQGAASTFDNIHAQTSKSDTPEPESVVNSQLAAGHIDNIQTVDQGAVSPFDNIRTQATKSDTPDPESVVNSQLAAGHIDNIQTVDQGAASTLDNIRTQTTKSDTPEPESVVNTQLAAGNSDNIQTVDQGAAFTFDNFNAQPTKLDANSVQNDTDSEIVLSEAKGQTTASKQAQLLSSIRDAQQINTNVQSNSTSSLANMQQINLNTTQGENQVVVDELVQGKQGSLGKNQLDSPINLTNKTTELVGTEQTSSLAEVPSAEGEQSDSEHTPATLKVEGLAAAQTITDVNGAKPIQTNAIQSDKLVAVNQQMQTTNHLLQEPLDIQSKQAAHLMGERVMMMLSEGKQEVQIRLDPAELGSMFIKVQVQQDQVQLNIQTQAGLSKDIIEQNMPRLREQLAQQGIQLSEANVEQQSQQSQQRQQSGQQASSTVFNGNTADNRDMVEDNGTAIWVPSKIASNDQGIDYYA